MKHFLFSIALFITLHLQAQNVGIGTTTPANSAMLEVNSNSKGLLIPRLSTSQRTAITTPANGLMVYDTNTNGFWYFNGNVWVSLSAGGATNYWNALDTNVYNNNAGRVGIGTTTPLAKLTVVGAGTWGTASFTGSTRTTHINYGGTENTFIRGGKLGSNVILNDDDGNVGIGTADPNAKLDVVGTTRSTNVAIGPGIFGNLTSGGALVVQNSNNNNFWTADGGRIQAQVRTAFTSNVSAAPFVLNPLGGNVGIGTNFTPEYKLHLYSAGEQLMKIDGTNSLVLFHDKTSNAQFGFLRAWTSNPFNPAGLYGLEIGTPPAAGSDPSKHLLFSTNYNLRMVILDNGNVGIGTTNPTYKLSVAGSIRAKEVVVETGWADYVFAPNYRLKPLQEVADFIDQHHHLPNIPSAKQIETSGLNVGDVQRRMMEKIEELTLYIIDLKKEIDQLKATQP